MANDKQLFSLEGQFEGFTAGGKSPFKYLNLRTAAEQVSIKLPKSVRLMLFRYLQVGDWIRVVGGQSVDTETGEPKLKAKEVVRVKPLELVTTPPVTAPKPTPAVATSRPKRKAPKILICQKSSCRKRGAMQVCDAVETALADQGLAETVQVKLTGCMDKCKAGPNMVVMPHKQRHTKVKPKQVPGLIAQNFQHDEVG